LHINTGAAKELRMDGTGSSRIRLLSGSTDNGNSVFVSTGDFAVSGGSATDLGLGTQSSNILMTRGGGTIARFTGDGLTFGSDTAAANALDDYEEGTWTPSAFNGANGATTTVNGSNRAANYVRIGKMVYISAYINLTKGSNTGNFEITGLPFPVDGTNSAHYPLAVGFFTGFANNMSCVYCTAQPSSSQVLGRFIPASHDDKVSSLTAGHLGTGTVEFMFGGCYRTSA